MKKHLHTLGDEPIRALYAILIGLFSSGKSIVTQAARRFLGPKYAASAGSILKLTGAAEARINERLAGRVLILDERSRCWRDRDEGRDAVEVPKT